MGFFKDVQVVVDGVGFGQVIVFEIEFVYQGVGFDDFFQGVGNYVLFDGGYGLVSVFEEGFFIFFGDCDFDQGLFGIQYCVGVGLGDGLGFYVGGQGVCDFGD